MAACLHTPYPEHGGELRFARRLVPMLGGDVHLWFSINYLPGVKDIDLLLWHEGIGVFAIEVKAIPIKMFESFNRDKCKIEGRKEGPSPQSQAYGAAEDLRIFLDSRKVERPWLTATAAFPLITRAQWNNYWDSDEFVGDFAEKLLFQEDFAAGPPGLENRLAKIRIDPPFRSGTAWTWKHDKDVLRSLDKVIVPPDAKPQPTQSDIDRLAAIERNVAKEAIEEVPAFAGARVGFTGHPGTGKTFRLLQIGAAHADQEASVLFLCFNKVLAADIRRLLQWSSRSAGGKDQIFDVHDVFQLLRLRLEENDLGAKGEDADSYGEVGVGMLEELHNGEEFQYRIPTYDTVLLDEAQDLKDWQIRLAELHLKDGGTFAVAIGTGQELYQGGLAERLKDLVKEIEPTPLPRNFRNTKETFQTAFVAKESKLDPTNIGRAARHFRDMQGTPKGVSFERKGPFPALKPFDTEAPSSKARPGGLFVEEEKERLATAYSRLIEEELEQLTEDEQPVDLLVLVPGSKSLEADAARMALAEINQEYFDLTEKNARRAVVPSTAVRLCTFHSSRGIEGSRVLILGFAQFERWERMGIAREQLAYVILSRSVFETTIAVRSDEWDSELIAFMQKALEYLQPNQ